MLSSSTDGAFIEASLRNKKDTLLVNKLKRSDHKSYLKSLVLRMKNVVDTFFTRLAIFRSFIT